MQQAPYVTSPIMTGSAPAKLCTISASTHANMSSPYRTRAEVTRLESTAPKRYRRRWRTCRDENMRRAVALPRGAAARPFSRVPAGAAKLFCGSDGVEPPPSATVRRHGGDGGRHEQVIQPNTENKKWLGKPRSCNLQGARRRPLPTQGRSECPPGSAVADAPSPASRARGERASARRAGRLRPTSPSSSFF